jgi:hypothetical protein
MIALGNTLVSRDVLEEAFVCDLKACKGACCVQGDAGAPLTESEAEYLKSTLPKITPFLAADGLNAIENLGAAVIDPQDGEWVTPLVNGQHCAYTLFSNSGEARCGIETAWKAGAIDFQKPISCHLYPIRIQQHPNYEAVNYDKWEICSAACSLGKELKVPVYQFLKTPLTRKYGEEWFNELLEVANHWEQEKRKSKNPR